MVNSSLLVVNCDSVWIIPYEHSMNVNSPSRPGFKLFLECCCLNYSFSQNWAQANCHFFYWAFTDTPIEESVPIRILLHLPYNFLLYGTAIYAPVLFRLSYAIASNDPPIWKVLHNEGIVLLMLFVHQLRDSAYGSHSEATITGVTISYFADHHALK